MYFIPNFSDGASGVWGLDELHPSTKPKFDFSLDKEILNYLMKKGRAWTPILKL